MTDQGLQYEADQRHAEILMKDMCVDESSKGVVTPGVVSTSDGVARLRKRNSATWRRKYTQSCGGERKSNQTRGACEDGLLHEGVRVRAEEWQARVVPDVGLNSVPSLPPFWDLAVTKLD